MQLTQHFTLEELTHSDIGARLGLDNTPDTATIDNLKRLADLLEVVRGVLGRPININSGYRSKPINDAVHSKDSSQHRLGCAADIRVSGMTPDEVIRCLIIHNVPYDQMIREFDSWTHISVPNETNGVPRKQVLIIDKEGTRIYP
jgi:hypothetical protein